MTNVELWINITIIVLLLPTIYYTILLSRQLKKMQQNQQRMIELAEALRRAAKAYAAAEPHRPSQPHSVSQTAAEEMPPATPFFEPQPQTACDAYSSTETFPIDTFAPAYSDGGGQPQSLAAVPATTAAEEPSEAELELLQALRSIK